MLFPCPRWLINKLLLFLDDHFGVAYSTIRFRDNSCAQ